MSAPDKRTHRIVTELTLIAAMLHWERLCDEGDELPQRYQPI